MRASTLFGLTIAVLIGAAVVVGVRSAGIFTKTPPAVQKQETPHILAAKRTLFEGITTTADDVFVRPMTPEELQLWTANKNKFLPAYPEVVGLRTLARNVEANQPLLKEHFQDIGLPGSFDTMLAPGMVAINVQIPKDLAAGGIIRRGDRVDVFLNTTICSDANCSVPFSATAPIASNLKVVTKRDSIFQQLKPVPDGPISFTLEANPFRAALIAFAKAKGTLALIPRGPGQGKEVSYASDTKDEEQRIIDFRRGVPVSDNDLEEIFKLGPVARAAGATTVEMMNGIFSRGLRNFPAESGAGAFAAIPAVQSGSGRSALGYRFTNGQPCTAPAARKG